MKYMNIKIYKTSLFIAKSLGECPPPSAYSLLKPIVLSLFSALKAFLVLHTMGSGTQGTTLIKEIYDFIVNFLLYDIIRKVAT